LFTFASSQGCFFRDLLPLSVLFIKVGPLLCTAGFLVMSVVWCCLPCRLAATLYFYQVFSHQGSDLPALLSEMKVSCFDRVSSSLRSDFNPHAASLSLFSKVSVSYPSFMIKTFLTSFLFRPIHGFSLRTAPLLYSPFPKLFFLYFLFMTTSDPTNPLAEFTCLEDCLVFFIMPVFSLTSQCLRSFPRSYQVRHPLLGFMMVTLGTNFFVPPFRVCYFLSLFQLLPIVVHGPMLLVK